MAGGGQGSTGRGGGFIGVGSRPVPTTTLVSWNLKGSAGPDLAAIAEHLRAEGADVVALQEVQRHQARSLARALNARSWGWGFKHWPVRTWPEGMAVIGVTRPVEVRTLALSQRWRPWSWRRRIVQVAAVDGPADCPVGASEAADPDSGALTVINIHLTPQGETGLRTIETATVLALVAERAGPVVVCGDLNERPDGPLHRQMAAAGLRDGWPERPPENATDPSRTGDPWPTNWRGWRPGTTKLPSQQLDYCYASAALPSLTVRMPAPDHAEFARFAALSDHLPITAEFDLP